MRYDTSTPGYVLKVQGISFRACKQINVNFPPGILDRDTGAAKSLHHVSHMKNKNQ